MNTWDLLCQKKSKCISSPGQNYFVHFALRYPVLVVHKSRFQRLRLVKQYMYVVQYTMSISRPGRCNRNKVDLLISCLSWGSSPMRHLAKGDLLAFSPQRYILITLHILCLFDGKFIRHGLVVTKLCGANALSIVMMGFCVNRREETFFFFML